MFKVTTTSYYQSSLTSVPPKTPHKDWDTIPQPVVPGHLSKGVPHHCLPRLSSLCPAASSPCSTVGCTGSAGAQGAWDASVQKPCSHRTGPSTSPAPRGGLSTHPSPSSPTCITHRDPYTSCLQQCFPGREAMESSLGVKCPLLSLEACPWWQPEAAALQISPQSSEGPSCPGAQRWGHEAGLSPGAALHILGGHTLLTLRAHRCSHTYKDTFSLEFPLSL